jgi:two-component system chemotaxis response regulator CheY
MAKLKQIPEESTNRLHLFIKSLHQQIESSMASALGVEFELIAEKPGMASVSDLGDAINSLSLIAKLDVEEIDKGEAFVIAGMASVHVLNGVIVLTPEDKVLENINNGTFKESDQESFKGLVSDLLGSMNKTLSSTIGENHSLRMKEIFQSAVESRTKSIKDFPKGNFLVFNYRIKIANYPEVSIWFVIPRLTGEKLFDCSLEPVVDWSDRIVAVAYDTCMLDREIIRKTLEKINVCVADFDDLKALLNGIFRENVDIVILEVSPQNWDSLLISKRIRKSTKTMNIPIVLILADPTQEMIYSAYKLGVRDFLIKPIKQDELIKTIQRLISEAA